MFNTIINYINNSYINTDKMATQKRLLKELKDITENPPIGCSAGKHKNDLYEWDASIIGPTESPYSGGIFRLKILFTDKYPFKPPKIKFVTKILHPNISTKGSICLDILNKNWSPVLSVTKVLLSISSLLTDPNPDDPLNIQIAEVYKKNIDDFNKSARNFTLKYAR